MMTKRNVMPRKLMAMGFAFVLSGCATIREAPKESERQAAQLRLDEDWRRAETTNTIRGYKEYLAKPPRGTFSPSGGRAQIATGQLFNRPPHSIYQGRDRLRRWRTCA